MLNLDNTAVTDSGLKNITLLKKLRVVSLANTHTSETGAKLLKDLHPNVQLSWEINSGVGGGGQRSDPDFDVSVAHPAYINKHPMVLFDEAHNNFHTASGRYKPFADLITNDGYRVVSNKEAVTPATLTEYDILIIANATVGSGREKSAFTAAECDSIQNWVNAGGSLLLITDHEPFGSASEELGKRFGVEMSFARNR